MRRLQINAQISATTSILEFSGSVFWIIIASYYKGTNYVGLISAITIYDILLPYALLANTSHNKNRIIELGWQNVIKNVLGFPNIVGDDNGRNSNETPNANETTKDGGTSTSSVKTVKLNNHGDSETLSSTIYKRSSLGSKTLESESTLHVPAVENQSTDDKTRKERSEFANLDAEAMARMARIARL